MKRGWILAKRASRGPWILGLGLVALLGGGTAWSQFIIGPIFGFYAPMDNRIALNRGCRDGGPGGLNRMLPEWVSVQAEDTPRVAEGTVRRSAVTFEDAPNSHFSHDHNFDVALDFGYTSLHSDANPVVNNERHMEMEWETKFFPTQFWPIPGDRVWMMGRWVFDCGHPPYRTEFHPPLAVAFTRLEPTTFPGDSKPTLTNRTSVFIHGRGGYYDSPVAVRDYEFDVPVPPRPSPRHQLRAQVVSLPFGGPSPILTTPDGNRVHVRYPLKAVNDPSPDRKFGAVIAAGWVDNLTTVGGPSFRVLRVTFDSIRINTDHDPFTSGSGEWRLWARAGSQWFEVTGLGDVDNGETVRINKSVLITVPESGATPVGIQTTGWEDDCDSQFVKTATRTPTLGDLECKVNGNDRIGFIAHDYTKAENFGIGTHDIASTRNNVADTQGDFNLRYRIEQVSVVNSGPIIGPIFGGIFGR